MSKESPPEGHSDIPELKVLTEEQASSLTAQFRFMLIHEVKNMKLEVIENIGFMLARRSGIDRDVRDQAARIDLLAKTVEDFGKRLSEIEKAQGIKHFGPGVHGSRDLTAPSHSQTEKAPSPPAPAPVPDEELAITLVSEHRRGRPPGKGAYEVYNAAKRARKAGGTL